MDTSRQVLSYPQQTEIEQREQRGNCRYRQPCFEMTSPVDPDSLPRRSLYNDDISDASDNKQKTTG